MIDQDFFDSGVLLFRHLLKFRLGIIGRRAHRTNGKPTAAREAVQRTIDKPLLLSLRCFRCYYCGCAAGIAAAWIFSLWGSADLFNAFYQANHSGLLAGQLGAAYFIPTVIVPLLLITHGLAFRILLQHENESATNEARQQAHGLT